jgi:hypothetical protein
MSMQWLSVLGAARILPRQDIIVFAPSESTCRATRPDQENARRTSELIGEEGTCGAIAHPCATSGSDVCSAILLSGPMMVRMDGLVLPPSCTQR